MNTFTKIYTGKQLVGIVDGDTFSKRVHSARHFLKYPPGIASSLDAICEAAKAGAVHLLLHDEDTQTQFKTTVNHLLQTGENLNRKHGAQLFLPLIHFAFKPYTASVWVTQGQVVEQHGAADITFDGTKCVRHKGDPRFPDGHERYPICGRRGEVLQKLGDGAVNFYCIGCADENRRKSNAVTVAAKVK
jgi:hypothetical protein